MPRRPLAGSGVVAIGLALAAWRVRPPVPDQPTGFLIVNVGLVLLGLCLVAIEAARWWSSGRDGLPPATLGPHEPERARLPFLGVVAGTGMVALGPHLAAVFTGAILTAWSAWAMNHGSGRARPLPLAPGVTLLLVPLYRFLDTVAGPEGLSIAALDRIPVSSAAETLAAPGLLAVSWALSGLWPFHRQLPGALSAPACAILLYRVGLELMPEGLAHWRPAAFPIFVLGIWHAALKRRPELMAVGGGMLGMASLDKDGLAGAAWLLAAAVALETFRRTRLGAGGAARAAVALPAAWGGLEATTGGLRVEVVYTVLAAAGVAVGFLRRVSLRRSAP